MSLQVEVKVNEILVQPFDQFKLFLHLLGHYFPDFIERIFVNEMLLVNGCSFSMTNDLFFLEISFDQTHGSVHHLGLK